MLVENFNTTGLFGQNSSDEDFTDEGSTQQISFDKGLTQTTYKSTDYDNYNANRVWPCSLPLAVFIINNPDMKKPTRFMELGSATGALACYLFKFRNDWSMVTSDRNDQIVKDQIAETFKLNDCVPVNHFLHSWGDVIKIIPEFDVLIGADLLIYANAYHLLVKTLCVLLKGRKVFYMSWQRRMKNEADLVFFTLCKNAGLDVELLNNRIYKIRFL
jgi:predicted nicotinamide N-methyase